MVSVIVIAALVAAGMWAWLDFKYRYYKEQSELFKELYENEQGWRIDTEIELGRVMTQLDDSRATVSNMISRNARLWLGEAAGKMVH